MIYAGACCCMFAVRRVAQLPRMWQQVMMHMGCLVIVYVGRLEPSGRLALARASFEACLALRSVSCHIDTLIFIAAVAYKAYQLAHAAYHRSSSSNHTDADIRIGVPFMTPRSGAIESITLPNECPICTLPWDTRHLPMLSRCGHWACASCLIQVQDALASECAKFPCGCGSTPLHACTRAFGC